MKTSHFLATSIILSFRFSTHKTKLKIQAAGTVEGSNLMFSATPYFNITNFSSNKYILLLSFGQILLNGDLSKIDYSLQIKPSFLSKNETDGGLSLTVN
jgi:hypothetical protein